MSVCLDAMTGGMARIYILGRNAPINEPWPDVIGFSIIFVVSVMFMLGLEVRFRRRDQSFNLINTKVIAHSTEFQSIRIHIGAECDGGDECLWSDGLSSWFSHCLAVAAMAPEEILRSK